ncbi:hypothetical protein [Mycobacterium sp. IS-1264]|uniref:hypothetical protein n=1 Tax=Mycobacterium sp. IS-1264 TaxID=1834158 RepID=UPI001115A619|nr:hypothetical protein [Mycobacterium sp. IS-1264]
MFALLTVALFITLGVAIVGWFRPVPAKPEAASAPTYSSQQVAGAKSKVCAAFEKADSAVKATSARDKGAEYATQLATAVNVRQSLIAGSQYLLTTLNNEPATPADLAANIRSLANAYQLLAIELQSDAPDSEKDPTVRSGDETTSTLRNMCK